MLKQLQDAISARFASFGNDIITVLSATPVPKGTIVAFKRENGSFVEYRMCYVSDKLGVCANILAQD